MQNRAQGKTERRSATSEPASTPGGRRGSGPASGPDPAHGAAAASGERGIEAMLTKTTAAVAGALAGILLISTSAFAQTAECGEIQKTLQARKDLVAKANAASNTKKKMTPQEACALFGKLQTNGAEGLKWITANKEWCSIPDSFAEGFKADHLKVSGIRTKICSVAVQATKMEAQARAQAQNNAGGGLLGGPGLTGSFKLPQGAL